MKIQWLFCLLSVFDCLPLCARVCVCVCVCVCEVRHPYCLTRYACLSYSSCVMLQVTVCKGGATVKQTMTNLSQYKYTPVALNRY